MDIHFNSKREMRNSTTENRELILWYDEGSNILFKIKSLIDICNLSEKDSIIIVLDSLLDGNAKITTGKLDMLIQLQAALQNRMILTTIE